MKRRTLTIAERGSPCRRTPSCEKIATCCVQIDFREWTPSCDEHAILFEDESQFDEFMPLAERVRLHVDWWERCRTCQFWHGDRHRVASIGRCSVGLTSQDEDYGCYRWDTFDIEAAEIVMRWDPSDGSTSPDVVLAMNDRLTPQLCELCDHVVSYVLPQSQRMCLSCCTRMQHLLLCERTLTGKMWACDRRLEKRVDLPWDDIRVCCSQHLQSLRCSGDELWTWVYVGGPCVPNLGYALVRGTLIVDFDMMNFRDAR